MLLLVNGKYTMKWFLNLLEKILINTGILADEEMSKELSRIDDELRKKGL